MDQKHFLIFSIFLFLTLLASPVHAEVVDIHLGENKTITDMNWHETWTVIPAPSNPGTLPPAQIEATSTNNSAYTYVNATSSLGPCEDGQCPCEDGQSGNANSNIGVNLYVDGTMGKSSKAIITLNYSYSGDCFSTGGTGHSTLSSSHSGSLIDQFICHEPSDTRAFGSSKNESYPFFFQEGQNYKIGFSLYSHADACTSSSRSSLSAAINSIKIEFIDSKPSHFGQNSNSGLSADPVNTALGNYTYLHTDLKIPGRSLGLEFTRSYNSQDGYQGPLGYGWTHSYNILLNFLDSNGISVKYGDGHEEGYTSNGDGTFHPNYGGFYSSLLKNNDNTYTLTDKAQTHYNFSSIGKLNSIVDKNGNAISLAYSGENLTTIIDASTGRGLTLTYDGSNLTQISDPLGRTFAYTYDSNGNLASFTDAKGGDWYYEYDSFHQLTLLKNPKGGTLLSNVYTNFRVSLQTNGRGYTSTFQYGVPNPGETTITDAMGNVTIHTHDSGYQLLRETDPQGYFTEYTYDANGNKTQVKDKKGSVTNFLYDAMGNITSKTDALSLTTNITYDTKNNPLTHVDALGNTTLFAYDNNGNLTTDTNPLGHATSYTYNSYGQILSKSDAKSHTTSFDYDTWGNLVKVKDPLNNETSYPFDVVGRKIGETDANGHATTFVYDLNDNLLSTTDALGHSFGFVYDANNNKISATDKNGHSTQYSYDANDNQITITNPDGNHIVYAYDALDRKTSATDPLGHITSYVYDTTGNVISEVNSLGQTTSHSYDPNGNRLTTRNSLNRTTTFTYDLVNRLTSIADPLGNTAYKAYDGLGRLISSTDANDYVTQYAYDPAGRFVRVTEAGGQITSYAYDEAGNKLAMTDAIGKTTSYAYDAANRLASETDPSGNTKTFTYDNAGNLTTLQKADGTVLGFGYDASNRLVTRSYPVGPSTTFNYDANGNKTGMTDKLGTTSWGYDAMNRLTAYTDPFGKEVYYQYDANGNRTQIIYPGNHPVSYTYDGANRLVAVSDWLNNTTAYQYDSIGNLLSVSHFGGSSANYSYDDASRLTGLINQKANSSVISGYSYTLDGAGNHIGEQRNEPLNPGLSASSIASTFGNDNRIQTAGSTVYTHDANGNRTSQTGAHATTFTYDYDDRLTASSGTNNIQYSYDGLGNRLSRNENSTQTRYILDVGGTLPSVIAETNQAGSVTAYYIHGLGLLYKLLPDGKTYIYHYDNLGSTIAMTDADGQVVNTYAYGPFGELIGSSGNVANRFGFVGKYGITEEGSGLKFMRARYYDSDTGRFVSKDLLDGNVMKPQELHRYVYVQNNPIKLIDPMGLCSKDVPGMNAFSKIYSALQTALGNFQYAWGNNALTGEDPGNSADSIFGIMDPDWTSVLIVAGTFDPMQYRPDKRGLEATGDTYLFWKTIWSEIRVGLGLAATASPIPQVAMSMLPVGQDINKEIRKMALQGAEFLSQAYLQGKFQEEEINSILGAHLILSGQKKIHEIYR